LFVWIVYWASSQRAGILFVWIVVWANSMRNSLVDRTYGVAACYAVQFLEFHFFLIQYGHFNRPSFYVIVIGFLVYTYAYSIVLLHDMENNFETPRRRGNRNDVRDVIERPGDGIKRLISVIIIKWNNILR